MKITKMANVKNWLIRNEEIDINDLRRMLSTPKIGPKGTTGCWIGGVHKMIKDKEGCSHREVVSRTIITLDIDHPKEDFQGRINRVLKENDYSFDSIYMTHTSASATPSDPRSRLIIPLNREVNNTEYKIITSVLMADISPDDLEREKTEREFDWTCTEFARLFYLPSIPKPDSFFEFNFEDGKLLNPDDVIDWYLFCKDGYDPYITLHGAAKKREPATGTKREKKTGPFGFNGEDYAGDPREKDSIIGSFCRIFDIETAIEEFNLPYEYSGANKWKYEPSSSPPGAIIDETGMFFYSSHTTDPASTGHVLNAFDLVRIHKIANGEMTEENSMREMYKLAMQNPEVKEIEQKRAKNFKRKK